MIYFSQEAEDEFTGLGLKAGRMSYFAGRAAPMGAAGPGVVAATFYNFNPSLVARHIPKAWSIASPQQVVEARFRAADAALRRLLGDQVSSSEVAEAAQLARKAAEQAGGEARPLFAGHADLDWPQEPHLVLWHAATLLREYRGDGHLTALLRAEVNGLEALITHTATGKGFVVEFAQQSRGWSPEEWAAGTEELRRRGILTSTGDLSEAGESLRQEVEAQTDRLGLRPFEALSDDDAHRLAGVGKELSKAVSAIFPSGVFAGR